jgi:hypothetical protein
MYKKMHVTYSGEDDLTLTYNINDTSIAQRWAKLLAESVEKYSIDDPERLYGFDTETIERTRAVDAINRCIDIINEYRPNFVERRMTTQLHQDDLNYLHHIFEVYHGMLNEPHEFFTDAPKEVQHALGQLNIEVHRCEAMSPGSIRKLMPRHVVTYYDQPRGQEHRQLQDEDYEEFTDLTEFGTVYLLYVEIGKTLQDLAFDNDQHIGDEAYKPFRHYASDFVIRYFTNSHSTWNKNRKIFKKHYDENKEFYDSRYNYSHIYNRPGNIPLAKLQTHMTQEQVVTEIQKRQRVSSVTLT